jgi:hypothetical protein
MGMLYAHASWLEVTKEVRIPELEAGTQSKVIFRVKSRT